MATMSLPSDPDLGQLRRQARELQRAARAAAPAALELLAEHGVDRSEAPGLRLATAQRVLARAYGAGSWPGLVRHVEVVRRLRRAPDDVGPSADPVDELLRLACLTYGADDPARPRAAAARLAADPVLGRTGIHAAAATADVEALRRLLADDPGLARSEGGPFGWVPLLYLAYARHDPALSADRVLAAADRLLGAGADPDAGYLWHGLPTPFTALTGALGGGESGQPAHPQGLVLARRLLEAGADANDGQALYNRMFGADDSHLELLLAHGLGQGDGGPWRRRLGPVLPAPTELLRSQLRWAVDHGLVDRVRLLAGHGVDVRGPFTEPAYGERTASGLAPAELAARHGDHEMLAALLALGADPVRLDPVATLVSAVLRGRADLASDVLRGDRWAERGVTADDADLLALAHAARPALVVQAAAAGRPDAVRLAVDLGFDVDAKGRSDTPSDQPWETALHAAVSADRPDLVALLLELGADPSLRDARFDGTPRDWAEHLGRPEIATLLDEA